MTVMTPQEAVEWLRRDGDRCPCGRPLEPCLDAGGRRIGVQHRSIEDSDYHDRFFAGLVVEAKEAP